MRCLEICPGAKGGGGGGEGGGGGGRGVNNEITQYLIVMYSVLHNVGNPFFPNCLQLEVSEPFLI